MRSLPKVLLLLLPLFAVALPAQSVISIANEQCVWHEGDDPTWAAATLDESDWRPFAEFKQPFGLTRIWVRCHPDLSLLQSQPQPALQVSLVGAYQVYLNGQLIGGEGDVENGYSSVNSIRSFPVSPGLLGSQPASVALRVTYRTVTFLGGISYLYTNDAMHLRAGSRPLLDALFAAAVVSRTLPFALPVLCFGVIGVIAVMLLGLYFYDRSRLEILLLSLACLALAGIRVK
jgi:hypothetical protein